MAFDLSAARFASGRLRRLRRFATREAVAERGAPAPVLAAPPAGVVPEAAAGSRTIQDLSPVGTLLTQHGHRVRVSDRTASGDLSAASSRATALVVEEVAKIIVRRAPGELLVSIRLRTEGEQVVLTVQTTAATERPRPLLVTPRDEDALRRRIEGADGRATLRATQGGNWLVVARIPR